MRVRTEKAAVERAQETASCEQSKGFLAESSLYILLILRFLASLTRAALIYD